MDVYVYALDTLADWELGFVTAELNSGQYFKKGVENVSLQVAGASGKAVTTKGGMRVTPEITTEEILTSPKTVLLLPGADTWKDPIHKPVMKKAAELLDSGGTVAAVCGATMRLADEGVLNNRVHTSNSLDYLKMFSSNYNGEAYYKEEKAVADSHLITAGSAGALLFAKLILEELQVFSETALAAWYEYFHTGDPQYFYKLMEAALD